MRICGGLVVLRLFSCAETLTEPEVTETVQSVSDRGHFQTILRGVEVKVLLEKSLEGNILTTDYLLSQGIDSTSSHPM
jgi:hypothetical protein